MNEMVANQLTSFLNAAADHAIELLERGQLSPTEEKFCKEVTAVAVMFTILGVGKGGTPS